MKAEEIPLSIRNLVVKYGDFTAVNDLSIDLKPGEIFGLLGPNGAGKTSTIACLVTLERPSSGEIDVFGHSVLKKANETKKLIGYVPQEVINHGFFSVIEIMRFHSGYFGKSKDEEYIKYLLQRMDLYVHRDKKVKQLSGGMKRRLMIAKALVHKPRLLLLDEPTAGVDLELRKSLWDFVQELRNEGVTFLLTTHYLEEAQALCDRIAILHQGRVLKVGPTQSLIEDLTQRYLKIDFNKNIDLQHDYLVEKSDKQMIFKMPSKSKIGDILREIGSDVGCIEDIHLIEGSLEDAFKIILEKGSL